MAVENNHKVKKFFFYWLTASAIAVAGYYLLWVVMPNHRVFGEWFRMYGYHHNHPLGYILIPCFVYGIIATGFSPRYPKQTGFQQISTTVILAGLVILCSAPFGGMLWVYHDMKAGQFPANWHSMVLWKGTTLGMAYGWLVVALSFPYNVLGLFVCQQLTARGAKLFDRPSGEVAAG